MTEVEKAQQAWQEAFVAAGEARNTCSRAVRDRPAYGAYGYEEYQRDVMKPLIKARDRAMAAEKVAKNELAEARKAAELAGNFEVTSDGYVKTMTNLDTGKSVTEGQQVRVGKGKTVWDVMHVFAATGTVELQHQRPMGPPYKRSGVMYRKFPFNQLTVVSEES